MRVLVTGGTGFIGSAWCRRLLQAGERVDVLTRDRPRAERHFAGAVGAYESLAEIDPEQAPEVIVNLAGENLGSGRWNRARKRRFLRSRVGTTEDLVDYIAGAPRPPRLLISGSAVGYYGARGDARLSEGDPPGDEYQSELCRQWEAAAERARDHGVRVCLSRTGAVMGRGGGPLSGLVPQFCRYLGGFVGSGRQWISWIHIDDLLDSFQAFIDDDTLEGAFNNTAPEPVTNRDFARILGEVLGRPTPVWAPGWLLRLAMGEMAHLYLTGQRVIPQRHIERGVPYRYPDMRSALSELVGPGDCR